jgi:Helix-turn-helix domain
MAEIFGLDVPASEKLVLLALADHARDDGTGAYPSIGLLASKTSQSRRGVQKILRRLEQGRLVVPSNVSHGRRATEYRITLANREPGSLFGPTQPRTPAHPTANLSASNREPRSPESLGTVREAADAAAAPPNLEAWTGIGLAQPVGDAAFRQFWETSWATKNGHPLAVVMGNAADGWEAAGGRVPRQYFAQLAAIRQRERAAATVEDEIPLAEPYR